MLIRTVSHILKKRARSLMTFIIIMLVFWRTNNWTVSFNCLNMQLTSASLLNILLILIFLIITLTIEQATMYIRHKKATRATIFFKCIDFVELSLIESMCAFLYVFWLYNDSSFFWYRFYLFVDDVAKHLFKQFEKILNNLRRRISINVFNIYLIISIEFNCFLMICVNFLNLLVISTTSTRLNLINFIFLYSTVYEFELMSTKIFFIATSAREISINFKFLLKMTLFVKFTAFE